jgi:hypothetical protein
MPYYSAGARAPFEPHRGEARQAGTSISSQATHGRQAVREPSPSDLSTLRVRLIAIQPDPQRLLEVSIRRIRAQSPYVFPSPSVMVSTGAGGAGSCRITCAGPLEALDGGVTTPSGDGYVRPGLTHHMRQMRAFSVGRGLYRYAGDANHRAVDANDGRNAHDVVSRPNKRALTRRYLQSGLGRLRCNRRESFVCFCGVVGALPGQCLRRRV